MKHWEKWAVILAGLWLVSVSFGAATNRFDVIIMKNPGGIIVWPDGNQTNKPGEGAGSGDLTEVQTTGVGITVDSGTGPIPIIRLTNAALSGLVRSNAVLQFNAAGVLTNVIQGATPLFDASAFLGAGMTNLSDFNNDVPFLVTETDPLALKSAVNAFGTGGGIVTNWIYEVAAGSNTTVSVETNAQTITYTVNASGGGGSVSFYGDEFVVRGSDFQPKAVSNFWGKAEVFIDSTIVVSGAGFGTYYTNSVQRGDLIATIPRNALRTNGNLYATALALHYFHFGNNTNTFIDVFLYDQQTGADGSITNSLLIYTNAASFGAVAVNVPTNFPIPLSGISATNLLDKVLRVSVQSTATDYRTNNGTAIIGVKVGF